MDDEKVIFLAYRNENTTATLEREYLSCKKCNNKTFVAIYFGSEYPTLQCPICGSNAGEIGWVK